MALPVSYYSKTYNDNTVKSNGEPESASIQLAITTLTAANYVAKKALIDNLAAAMNDLAIGQPAKSEIVIDRELLSTLPASSTAAQRENKLLLRYHGNTLNKKFRASLPTFDLSTLPNHSEFLDLTAGLGAALKTAFEAIVVSPDDSSEAVTLDSAQFVGRNT